MVISENSLAMTWNYAYTPNIWPSFFTVIVLIGLSILSWRRRSVPGALQFTIFCLLTMLVALSMIMEYSAVDAVTKIFWFKVKYIWLLPSVTAMTCFILEYAWPGRWLTRRNVALLFIGPLLALALILTNNFHHLSFLDFAVGKSVTPVYGWVSWFFIAYLFALTVINIIVFVWLFLRSPQHRWPVAIMLTAQILIRGLFLANETLSISELQSIPELDIGVVLYAIALYGFRILDPVPLANQTIIAQMREGVLVLDPQGKVASLNPAAEPIFHLSVKQAKGLQIGELLPLNWEEHKDDPDGTEIEVSFPEDHPIGKIQGALQDNGRIARDHVGAESKIRYYVVETSCLKDFRGLTVGRLLMLHDITDQKQARAQALEQQRTLAALQERALLARELHDSLGQTLAAAHLQASSARLLLNQGKIAQTDECLAALADMTIAAESDVREYLLGAKTFFSSDHAFFQVLRQYMLRFGQQYGLQVELSAPAELEAQGLNPAIELQLLRIIQESLSNVRKHARAKSVQVDFGVSETILRVAICDNGQGFDPAAVATPQGEGFGLQAMRERADALGGHLEVISQPGQGTQVIVQVPVGRETRSHGEAETRNTEVAG